VTVIVELAVPFAVTLAGLSFTDDCAVVPGPAATTNAPLDWVKDPSLAVKVYVPALSTTRLENVAVPPLTLAEADPEVKVDWGLPAAIARAIVPVAVVTTLP
jgi:hypothetical protein